MTIFAACVIAMASWYGDECAGKPMANGRPFDPSAMTCASWDWPLCTRLKITRTEEVRLRCLDRSVTVVVTDRGPAKRLYRQGRKIDLSRAAFARIADLSHGLVRVRIEKTGD